MLQVSAHLAKRFQRKRILKKSANQKQVLPVADMFNLLTDQDEMCTIYRGPSIYASY